MKHDLSDTAILYQCGQDLIVLALEDFKPHVRPALVHAENALGEGTGIHCAERSQLLGKCPVAFVAQAAKENALSKDFSVAQHIRLTAKQRHEVRGSSSRRSEDDKPH